jgi:hypothetical protein
MWDMGLGYTIPAFFITFSTALVGGVFVVLAWTRVIRKSDAASRRSVSAALYTFTVAVFLDVAGWLWLWEVEADWITSPYFRKAEHACSFFIIASFVCLVASMVLVRKGSGAETGVVKAGSKTLFAIAVLGSIWFVLARPGMPLS